jgi:predicted deacylase
VDKGRSARSAFEIGGQSVPAGQRRRVDFPISLLSNHTEMYLSVMAVHGRRPGPTVFVSGAIHGDEIIGVEIIRRIARSSLLSRLSGTLLLAPIVNAYGFIGLSRYLPDRRDLNRSFPGMESGSLASQLAFTFMREIATRSQFGIDLHSGAVHRENLPQIRARLDDEQARSLAKAFGAPIVLNSNLRDGSLRQAAQEEGCTMLLYEAGEALRFDERAIRIGAAGVVNVLRRLDMLPASGRPATKPIFSQSSNWLRAPIGGVMRSLRPLGAYVKEGDVVATISDPFGEVEEPAISKFDGVIIGRTNLPILNRGDALCHIAQVFDPEAAGATLECLEVPLDEDPLLDDISSA